LALCYASSVARPLAVTGNVRLLAAPRSSTPSICDLYVLSWAAFGLLAWAILRAAGAVAPDALAWDRGGRYLAGTVILLAAAYELTPAKHACLRKCRSPFSFLFGGWRSGGFGAFRLGAGHGAWCIGCCWALMVALFALGVMSVAWMALVGALIAAEKLLPWPRAASRGITVLLVVLGISVALVPDRVPGLVLPDPAHAMPAQMGGRDAALNRPAGDTAAEAGGWRGAIAYCRRREHLRRTLRIALVVGLVLTAINQLDVILRGHATTITVVKCGLNFVVPFIVSNLGLLSGWR
jgi:hypothetical protein